MIFFQTLNYFSINLGYDTGLYWFFRYWNWLPIFMCCAGFGLGLLFEVSSLKTFWVKLLKRFAVFTFFGVCWLWFEGAVNPLEVFRYEVISAIGLSSVFAGILIFPLRVFKNDKDRDRMGMSLLCLFVLFSSVYIFHRTFQTGVALFKIGVIPTIVDLSSFLPSSFNPFWLLQFIFFGFSLATCRKYKSVQLSLCILCFTIFLLLGLPFKKVDIYSQGIEFTIFNCGLFVLLLWFFQILNFYDNKINNILNYFGQNSLFFYMIHLVLPFIIVTTFNIKKQLNDVQSITITLFLIFSFVLMKELLQKTYKHFNFVKI